MPYDIPEGANEAIGSLGAVVLPFAAPIMFWRNGDKAFAGAKDVQDARRFGGWAIQPSEIDTMKESLPPELPADWLAMEFMGEKETYSNFITRRAYVAVIARRHAWFVNDGKSKSVTQYLGYLGERTENTINPWGPVILQAKSLGGVDLDKAVTQFKKLTAQFREGVKEQFFYAPLGTFGDAPEFQTHKSKDGNSQSAVTPVRVYQPPNGYGKKLVDILFVGRETAAEIVELRKQAQEWLDDWNNRRRTNGNGAAPEQDAPFGADDLQPPDDDGMPF